LSAFRLILASIVMGVGACVQGAVGFGSNIVAAPLLVLIDPLFVPGPISVASFVLNLLIIRRREGAADPAIRWAMYGLVPGTIAAGLTLTVLPARGLSLLFAAIVFAAVALTMSGLHIRRRPGTLAGAGVASGFMGTISGIGGPPIALAYQDADGPTLRATLPRYFLVSGTAGLVVLAAVGRLGAEEWRAAAVLLPGTLAGFAASRNLGRHLDRRTARPFVLALSAIAAAGVLVRELI
jgi:uncharacterized membrane protein YfcA